MNKNRDIINKNIFRRHDAFLMWVVLVMASGAMLFAVRTFSTNNKWLYLSFNPEANHTVTIKVRNALNCYKRGYATREKNRSSFYDSG